MNVLSKKRFVGPTSYSEMQLSQKKKKCKRRYMNAIQTRKKMYFSQKFTYFFPKSGHVIGNLVEENQN